MKNLLDAIIAGKLTLRQARVALALATRGAMGARKLASVTGIDVAHCRRTMAELRELGFPVDNPVDNPSGGWADSAHGVGQKSPRGGPIRPTWADSAHVLKPSTGAPSGGVWAESAHPQARSSGSGSTGSTQTTTTTTTTTTTGQAGYEAELIFPACISLELQPAARRLLAPLNGQAQALLDELAGRMATQQIKNPIAYLRGLVQRAKAGGFMPEAGIAVAAARHRQEEIRQAKAAREEAFREQIRRSKPPPEHIRALVERIRGRHAT